MPILQLGQGPTDITKIGVPGEGPRNAKIVIIGEAPGAVEVRPQPNYPRGRPFVGPAGGALAECMQNAGIIRQECYITNLFKVPVQKKRDSIYIDGQLMYTKSNGFTENAIPWILHLKSELEDLTGPNVIVTMGEVASFALTGRGSSKGMFLKPMSILRIRGSIYFCEWSEKLSNIKIIPCIHPAATLYGQDGESGGKYLWRYYIIFDLRRAKEESKTKGLTVPARNFIHDPSVELIEAYFDKITKEKIPQAVDLEVFNQEVSVIGVGQKDTGIVILLMHGNQHRYSVEEEMRIWRAFAKYIEDPDIMKTGQNMAFDLWLLAHKANILYQGPVFDTMVGWKQLYPDFEKGLDTIASILTNEPYYKDELKMWNTNMLNRLGGNTTDQMHTLRSYNEKDVSVTWEAAMKIKDELMQRDMWSTFEHTMEVFPAIIYIETRGIKVNKDQLKKVKLEIETKILTLKAELKAITGIELNINSSAQLKHYFYTTKKIPPYFNRKTKQPSCDDDALKRLARGTSTRAPLREASIIREIRSLSKLHGTYLTVNLDKDDRLRCSVNPAGTKNGRWSTSKTLFGNGTNMQNLPPQFKKFLEADEGAILMELDKKQGEWVLCAYISGDSNMIQVVESGEDAHIGTAARAFLVPKDLIAKEAKIVEHETDPVRVRSLREEGVPEILNYQIPGSMSCRQAGKKGNHGLNYDLGYRNFSLINEIPEAEGKRIVEAYHKAYPMVRNGLHTWVRDQLGKNRTLVNVFGRKRTFYDRWGDALFKDGYAFPAQSALVDLVNRGLAKITRDNKTFWMRWVDLLMQVHDSILFQYWLHNYDYRAAARAALRIGEHVNPTMFWQGREFQIGNDIKIGLNWGGFHEKHNPIGMYELKWLTNIEEMAEQLWEAHTLLLENKKNL